MSAFLRALSPGTQAVVAAHSTTIYLIMGDLGLDTTTSAGRTACR